MMGVLEQSRKDAAADVDAQQRQQRQVLGNAIHVRQDQQAIRHNLSRPDEDPV